MTEPTEDAARIAALEAENKRLQHEAEASDAAFKQCVRDLQLAEQGLRSVLRLQSPAVPTWMLIALALILLVLVVTTHGVIRMATRITALEERSK